MISLNSAGVSTGASLVPDPVVPADVPEVKMAMPSSQAGIPDPVPTAYTDALDKDFITRREEFAKAYRAKRDAYATKLDSALLDPESFFKKNPIDPMFAGNPEAFQKKTLVQAYLRLHNDGKPLADPFTRDLMRSNLARTRFDGRGAMADAEFYGEIVKEAQGRKNRKELATVLDDMAFNSIVKDGAGETAENFYQWREEAIKMPGYDQNSEADYFERWHEVQRAGQDAIAPFRDELASVWKAMKGGGMKKMTVLKELLPFQSLIGEDLGAELQKKDAGAVAFEIYDKLDADDRAGFMDAMHYMVKTFPKEERAAIFANMAKSGGRMVDDLARGSVSRFSVKGLEQALNEEIAGSMGPWGANPEEKAQAAGNAKRIQADRLKQKNFVDAIRKMERGEYAPVRHFSKESDAFFSMRTLEEGVYGVPVVFASVGTMLIPGVGPALMYGAMEDFAYADLRDIGIKNGASEEDASRFADDWKVAAAIPQTALEIFQNNLALGKLPGVSKVLTKASDGIRNRAIRLAMKTGTIGLTETAVEEAQNLTPYTLHTLANALSVDTGTDSTDWMNGNNGALDGFWTRQATTFISMLPMAAFGGMGGMNAEARARALAKASPLERRAFGITDEASAALDAAAAQGQSSLNEAAEAALQSRVPQSEQAKAAVEELAAEIEEQRAAVEAAQQSGAFPTFHREGEMITVRDGETGAEVGQASTNADALRIAATHSSAIDERNADQVAYLATMLEAGEQTTGTDSETRKTSFTFKPGESGRFTAADGKVSSDSELTPADEARILAQSRIKGGIFTGTILGQSVTEFKNRARAITERITNNRVTGSGSVLTVFHEESHGYFREALEAGRLSKEGVIATIRAVQAPLVGKRSKEIRNKAGEVTQEAQDLHFLPADGEVTDEMLDEAVAEFMETIILKTRKAKGDKMMTPAGTVSRNLSAMGRMNKAAGAFRNFVDAVRDLFGLALYRSYEIRKGIKEGKIDEAQINDFTSRLYGLNEQDTVDSAAEEAAGEILGEGDPFSIGRATVTPNELTRMFEGAEGSPTVLGPAAFSIGAYHGTPHKVDKFSLDKIGTGEGAQAFGYGLYFAQDRAVAKSYLRAGASVKSVDIDQAPNGTWYVTEGNSTIIGKELSEVDARAMQASRMATGNLYTVTLDVDHADLLDWDAPLSENPAVLAKVEAMDHPLLARAKRNGRNIGKMTARDLLDAMGGDPRGTAQALKEAGIPGIRYLDGNSRADGDGSRNFVIFDESKIQITEENGTPVDLSQHSKNSNTFSERVAGGDTSFAIASVKLTAAPYVETGADLRNRLIADVGNSVSNAYTGWDIGFYKEGAKHIVSQNKGADRLILPHLKELVEQAVWMGRRKHRDAGKERGIRWQHLFYAPYDSGGKAGVARFVVNETWQGERLMDSKASEAKIMPAELTVAVQPVKADSSIGSASKMTVRELRDSVKSLWPEDPATLRQPVNDRRDESKSFAIARADSPLISAIDAFSLGPAKMADVLAADAVSRVRDPLARAGVMSRMAQKLGDLKRDKDEIGIAFGKPFTRQAIKDPRGAATIRRDYQLRKQVARDQLEQDANVLSAEAIRSETSRRTARRAAELEEQVYAKHEGIFSNPDLMKLKQWPVHQFLADPATPLHGRLMSKSQAMARGENFFDESKQGDFDGADGVPRANFGGDLMPDQAAQELHDAGLIKEPTADAMWEALKKEAAQVPKFKEHLKAAKADLASAKEQAKTEIATWARGERIKRQELEEAQKASDAEIDDEMQAKLNREKSDHSPRQRLLRSLGMLDAIISTLPISERGRIGGHTNLAKLGTDEARLKYLGDRIAKVDEVLEKYLVKEYGKMLDKLLDRAKPTKGKAGEKPKGKAGADMHAIFDVLRDARGWSQDKVDQHVAGLEASLLSGNLTPEQFAKSTMEASLVGLVGNWKDADAVRRGAAVERATDAFQAGYARFKLAILLKSEDRKIRRDTLQADIGKSGDAGARDKRTLADNGLKAGWGINLLSLGSFEQVIETVFGRNSAEAQRIVDMERQAAHQKEDRTQEKMDSLDALFTRLGGGSELKGARLRHDLAQKTLKVGNRTLSAMEAVTATMMWRQPDGRRHMEGHKDENGKPSGKWHYDQAFIDEIESKLSAEAMEVRAHLSAEYAAEWAIINPVFRELNGIDLPSNPNYSPLTVKPANMPAGQMVDPVTGGSMTGASTTPGSLRTRGSFIAEPDFRDALQTYIAHTKQIYHWIAYAQFMDEAGTLLRSRELMNSAEERAGAEAVSILSGWLDNLQVGGSRDAATHLGLNRTLAKMSSNAAGAILIGRMGVIAIQTTQLAAALAEMPTGSFLLRFGKLMTGQLGWGAALKSDYIQRRITQMPIIVKQAMAGLRASKPSVLKHNVMKMGTLIGGMDGLMTAGTYAIVYDYQLKQAAGFGLTGSAAEMHARNAAERAVDRVAQPTRQGTRSLYENTAKNPASKILWAFASESRQKLALSLYRLGSKHYSAGEKARAVAVTWIIGGLIAEMVRAAMRDIRSDDDDEIFDERNWGMTRIVLSAMTGPLSGVPLLGDSLQAGIYGMDGQYQPEGNLVSALSQSFKDAMRVTDWGDSKPDQIMRDVDGILSGMGILNESVAAAASLSHLARDLYGIADNFTGD